MQKYNDEKLTDENLSKIYQKEIEEKNLSKLENFRLFQSKIETQNILNLASKVLGLIEEERKLLNELNFHIDSLKQNENKIYIRNLIEEENSLKILYSIENFEKLNFVKVKNNKPLLKNAIDVACNIVKVFFELSNFELNSKIKEIISKYIEENLDLILFLSSFLI